MKLSDLENKSTTELKEIILEMDKEITRLNELSCANLKQNEYSKNIIDRLIPYFPNEFIENKINSLSKRVAEIENLHTSKKEDK